MRSQQIQTDDAVGVDVRVDRNRPISMTNEHNFGCFYDVHGQAGCRLWLAIHVASINRRGRIVERKCDIPIG